MCLWLVCHGSPSSGAFSRDRYPRHCYILPFMQPGDVPHRIALTDAHIRAMHAADGHKDCDVPVDVVTTHSQAASKLLASGEMPRS